MFVFLRQVDEPKYESKWNCIFEAGASIASLAYKLEGKKYIPALLEEIDSVQQEEFYSEQLENILGSKIQLLDDFKNYLLDDNEKNKEKILKKLSDILD